MQEPAHVLIAATRHVDDSIDDPRSQRKNFNAIRSKRGAQFPFDQRAEIVRQNPRHDTPLFVVTVFGKRDQHNDGIVGMVRGRQHDDGVANGFVRFDDARDFVGRVRLRIVSEVHAAGEGIPACVSGQHHRGQTRRVGRFVLHQRRVDPAATKRRQLSGGHFGKGKRSSRYGPHAQRARRRLRRRRKQVHKRRRIARGDVRRRDLALPRQVLKSKPTFEIERLRQTPETKTKSLGKLRYARQTRVAFRQQTVAYSATNTQHRHADPLEHRRVGDHVLGRNLGERRARSQRGQQQQRLKLGVGKPRCRQYVGPLQRQRDKPRDEQPLVHARRVHIHRLRVRLSKCREYAKNRFVRLIRMRWRCRVRNDGQGESETFVRERFAPRGEFVVGDEKVRRQAFEAIADEGRSVG